MVPNDNSDTMLQTEEEKTSSASPAGTKTQMSDSEDPIEGGAEQRTSEEVEWNSLKGNTQERIKKVLKENKEYRQRLENFQTAPPPPPSLTYQKPPEVADAVRKLEEVGVATKDFVQEQLVKGLSSLQYQSELGRLEGKYNGEDGKPRFDRDEYDDYIGRHPEYRNYLPEDVYSKMYREELLDWEIQKGSSSPRTRTLRPTKTSVHEEPLSPELIESRLKEPDGRQWYERNKDKINAVLAKSAQ